MTPWTFLALAVAGGIGAGLRYIIDVVVSSAGRFPFGILVVNVSGSLLLGVVTGLGTAVLGEAAVILGVGLLGGYTTFSTVSVETVLLAQRRRRAHAVWNVLGTLALSLAAAALGLVLGGAVW